MYFLSIVCKGPLVCSAGGGGGGGGVALSLATLFHFSSVTSNSTLWDS